MENTPIFLARYLSNIPPLSYNHFDLGKIKNGIEALKNDMQIAFHVAKSHDSEHQVNIAQSANIGDSPQPPTLEREVSGTDLSAAFYLKG